MTTAKTENRFSASLKDLLQSADIRIDGDRPWDIHVHDERFYRRVVEELALGLGESYMDGWWDCDHLDQLFHKILTGNLQEKAGKNRQIIFHHLLNQVLNIQSKQRLRSSVHVSYERGVDLYMSFLDPYNQYSCAYFNGTDDLVEAQRRKMDLIGRKLKLSPADRVLDIGCGWGGLACFLAEHFGCEVVGINIARQQIEFAREFCKGLPVEIREMDYRDLAGPTFRKSFTKVVSVGMIEHIGYKNYRPYMEAAASCLRDDGIFLLHSIGANVSTSSSTGNLWIEKYIFPNSMAPSIPQLATAAEDLFIMQDLHNFGLYYDRTLMAWSENFERCWHTLEGRYDERFHRMWRYYLLSCAGGFRAGYNQLWQIVMTKINHPVQYEAVR